jgi:hypothetical protein
MPPSEADDGCVVRLSTPPEGTNHCDATAALLRVLDVERPDPEACFLTSDEADAVVERWGRPWEIPLPAAP